MLPPTVFLYLPPELGARQLVLQEQLHIIKAQFLRVAPQHIIDKLVLFMAPQLEGKSAPEELDGLV